MKKKMKKTTKRKKTSTRTSRTFIYTEATARKKSYPQQLLSHSHLTNGNPPLVGLIVG